ncbi:prepilin-type N-terminal cleavage/methylation domain-containing protein [Bdellovibrionota bacterium FG-1]
MPLTLNAKSALRNNQGFTLIELMVVVAIIGILVAIAGPQYSKFQAKARQTEAKIGLGAVYTAQKTFATENQSYTTCLQEIGVGSDSGRTYYTIGFKSGVPDTKACGPSPGVAGGDCNATGWSIDAAGVVTPAKCAATNPAVQAKLSVIAGNPAQIASLPATALADKVTNAVFIVGAAGQISTTGPATVDAWTIDQDNNLLNTTVGL